MCIDKFRNDQEPLFECIAVCIAVCVCEDKDASNLYSSLKLG